MTQEWSIEKLGDLVDPSRGISYGIVQPGEHQIDGVPIVRVSDLKGDTVETTKPLRVSTGIEAAYTRTRLRGGELIMSIVGTVGQTAIVDKSLAGWNVARAVAVIPVRKEIGPYWIRLSLKGGPARAHINDRLNTTVQATLNLRDLASLPIVLPPQGERDAIAATLGALDDKIELNRKMNATLESMARALFRDWFVDFGPTRAKMEGREPYLSPDLWSLFPERLDDEGKPEGWEFRPIYDYADVVYGAPFASKQFNAEGVGVPLIRIRDLATHEPSVWTEQAHSKGHMIEPGDIVVGMDGEFRLHIWKGAPAWLNQRVCHFEPLPNVPRSFLAEALIEPLAFFERGKVGTTVIHLGKGDIDTFRLLHPGEKLLAAFGSIVEPLITGTVRNAAESRTLARTRDLLLPRLMSGELQVSDLGNSKTERVA